MLSKAFNRKQTTQNFSSKQLKKNNLTVFEPKAPLRGCYETEAIPLSQTATVKDSLMNMFGLCIFSTQK